MIYSIQAGLTFVSFDTYYDGMSTYTPITRTAHTPQRQLEDFESAIAVLQAEVDQIRSTIAESVAQSANRITWITPTLDSRTQINKVVLIRLLRDTIRKDHDGAPLLTVGQGVNIVDDAIQTVMDGRPYKHRSFEFWCAVMSNAIYTCNGHSDQLLAQFNMRN